MTEVAVVAVLLASFGITLNPDGSGKVVVEITQSAPADSGGKKAAVSQVVVRDSALHWLRSVQGVDTWSDVSYGTMANGLITFKGTAYFKDLGKLLVQGTLEGGPLGTWTKDPKGGMLLEVHHGENKMPPARPPNLTDEELDQKVAAAQTAWKQEAQKMKMRVELGNLRQSHSYKLPGAAELVDGLKKQADGSLLFVIDRNEAFKAASELMSDAAYVRNCIKAGLRPVEDPRDPVMREKVYGTKGSPSARVTGEMKPQFDYAAEAKAAQEAYPKMMERLGLLAETGQGTAKRETD